MFDPVDARPNFPALESELVSYWKKNKIFEKSVENRPADNTWTFLDGPPFITGMPHYGSLLPSILKDTFPRFWTMKGYRVRRVWGWDCHGLPAENKVENKLGLKRKKDIEEKVGIKKFIEECKLYVGEVSSEWEWYIDHIARWVDFNNAYRTMDTDYMESVMWVFKQMYDKGHIYKGLRVSLYCPHCSTPISNFEIAMDNDNYKDVTDSGTIYKFELEDEENTYFLAWSTTPWTKIPTSALAVNADLDYVKVKVENDYYILAADTLDILNTEHKVIEKFKGKDLVDKKFIPHYDYYDIDEGKKAFVIVADDFVTAEEGTGIVTLAAYGEDDLRVMKENNIHIELHLDDEGHVLPDVPNFGGNYYLKVNKAVNEDLAERGLIYNDEKYVHSMPHCWRCGTQLYYAPQNAWFVDIQTLKPKLYENNKDINWYPNHFKEGRFRKSMESAPDWCISRSRYWGSPVPVWECECDWRFVPGSIKELEEKSGSKIDDLHRPEIDDVVVKCEKCGKDAHRVPEVLDSWIEAGSASFAERHFPFEDGTKLEDFFPPDFIVEYTGQIRAWFYVLHVIGTALFDSKAFKNVAVTGVILGTDGRKMSKNFGNYPDPRMMLEKYGGDALRLYLLGSPVTKGEDLIISEEEYRNQIKAMHIPLWNVFKFFVLYANLDGFDTKVESVDVSKVSVLDQWALQSLKKLKVDMTAALENYDTVASVRLITEFIDNFSRWYIRRSRDRVGPSVKDSDDKDQFYSTTYYVLTEFAKVAAPVIPFISESIYKHLTGKESVHLENWPEQEDVDENLLNEMEKVRKLVEISHRKRKEDKLKVRQPLKSVTIAVNEQYKLNENDSISELLELVKGELNVKEVLFKGGDTLEAEYDTTLTPELKMEGEARDIVREVQKARRKLNLQQGDVIKLVLPEYPEEFADYIKQRVMASSLTKGDKIEIEKISTT